MKIDGDVCADKKKIADGFNKFFTGAVQRLLQEFGQVKDSAVNQSEPRVSGNKSYPDEWKCAKVTPVFKKGKRSEWTTTVQSQFYQLPQSC